MMSEKRLEKKGFTLIYKSQFAAGAGIGEIKLSPVNLSEDQVRQQMQSLIYEELSLFGKKKPVFSREDITRAARLITKALNRAPSNKIVYYELETPRGGTEGVVFPSKNVLHWRFYSIQGGAFNNRPLTMWGGGNWRLVPGSRQQYHSTKKLLGAEALENWVKIDIPRRSRESRIDRDPPPSRSRSKRKSRQAAPPPTPKQAASSATDPELEKKLHFLKNLYEKNLIDEEEYNRKRKEILDNYL